MGLHNSWMLFAAFLPYLQSPSTRSWTPLSQETISKGFTNGGSFELSYHYWDGIYWRWWRCCNRRQFYKIKFAMFNWFPFWPNGPPEQGSGGGGLQIYLWIWGFPRVWLQHEGLVINKKIVRRNTWCEVDDNLKSDWHKTKGDICMVSAWHKIMTNLTSVFHQADIKLKLWPADLSVTINYKAYY